MIQFGGHHLGLNITLVGVQGTLAPSHTGAPAGDLRIRRQTCAPLGREADKAFALMNSLDEAQRKQAILGFQMRDLVLGPGRDGKTIQPEGIKGSELTEKQREMLLDLASEWTGIMNEAVATAKMDEMKKNIGDTWFAWSGPTEKAGGAPTSASKGRRSSLNTPHSAWAATRTTIFTPSTVTRRMITAVR